MTAIKIGPIQAEQRRTSRAKVYVNDCMVAKLRSGSLELECKVADFTPFGIGLITQVPESRVLFENGAEVVVHFKHHDSIIEQRGILMNRRTVDWRGENFTRIGVQFLGDAPLREGNQDSRQRQRFALSTTMPISATTRDPLYRNQTAFFRVQNMSRDGLLLKTSARNKFPLIGSRFDLDISIPSLGLFKEPIEVRYVRLNEDDNSYEIGCKMLNPKQKTLRALADYSLIFAGDISLKTLRSEGFPLALNSTAITVKSTDDREDFQEILELRRKTYGLAGTFGRTVRDPLSQFTDKYDDYSRHIIAKIGDRIVGAGRVIFTNGDLQRSDLINYVPQFPQHVLNEKFVEISKVCTDPDYRDGALLMRMSMEMFRISILDGAKYLALMSRDYMVSSYQRFGYEPYGDWYQVAGHNVKFMYADVQKLLKGQSVPFAVWTFLGQSIIREFIDKKQIEIDPLTRVKVKAAGILRPFLESSLERRIAKRNSQK